MSSKITPVDDYVEKWTGYITSVEEAIGEIVSNSFESYIESGKRGSINVYVDFDHNKIIVRDHSGGIDSDTLKNNVLKLGNEGEGVRKGEGIKEAIFICKVLGIASIKNSRFISAVISNYKEYKIYDDNVPVNTQAKEKYGLPGDGTVIICEVMDHFMPLSVDSLVSALQRSTTACCIDKIYGIDLYVNTRKVGCQLSDGKKLSETKFSISGYHESDCVIEVFTSEAVAKLEDVSDKMRMIVSSELRFYTIEGFEKELKKFTKVNGMYARVDCPFLSTLITGLYVHGSQKDNPFSVIKHGTKRMLNNNHPFVSKLLEYVVSVYRTVTDQINSEVRPQELSLSLLEESIQNIFGVDQDDIDNYVFDDEQIPWRV